MTQSGILEIQNKNGETVHTAFTTRDNYEGFVMELFADKEIVLSYSNDDDTGVSTVEVTNGRLPFSLRFEPRVLDHSPGLTLSYPYLKTILTRKRD